MPVNLDTLLRRRGRFFRAEDWVPYLFDDQIPTVPCFCDVACRFLGTLAARPLSFLPTLTAGFFREGIYVTMSTAVSESLQSDLGLGRVALTDACHEFVRQRAVPGCSVPFSDRLGFHVVQGTAYVVRGQEGGFPSQVPNSYPCLVFLQHPDRVCFWYRFTCHHCPHVRQRGFFRNRDPSTPQATVAFHELEASSSDKHGSVSETDTTAVLAEPVHSEHCIRYLIGY